jgi:hypothetical protein
MGDLTLSSTLLIATHVLYVAAVVFLVVELRRIRVPAQRWIARYRKQRGT